MTPIRAWPTRPLLGFSRGSTVSHLSLYKPLMDSARALSSRTTSLYRYQAISHVLMSICGSFFAYGLFAYRSSTDTVCSLPLINDRIRCAGCKKRIVVADICGDTDQLGVLTIIDQLPSLWLGLQLTAHKAQEDTRRV